MSCDQHQEALIDLACAGAEPRGDLRAHLDACPSCRASFDRERLLFAAIDSGVRQTANAHLPASLLSAIRAHVAQAASETVQRKGTASWMYAAAAISAALFLLALPFFRPRTPAVETVTHPEIYQSPEQKIPALQATAPSISANRSVQPMPKLHSGSASRSGQKHEPEVLVPAEEREALAKFASTVVERQNLAVALAHPAPNTNAEGLAIDPLNIAHIEVESLEEKALDSSARKD